MIMHMLIQLPCYHQNSNSTNMNIIVKVITYLTVVTVYYSEVGHYFIVVPTMTVNREMHACYMQVISVRIFQPS